MSLEVPVRRWTPEEFVDAWNAGVFEGHHRVQLVDGEVWDLGPIGPWHGKTVSRLSRLLYRPGVETTSQTLPVGAQSLPDPDLWVLREGAAPTGSVRGYPTWSLEDVLLVVEVADSSRAADLSVKARLYAGAGFGLYWVVTQDALHVFSAPADGEYTVKQVLRRGENAELPYAGGDTVAVEDLLG